MTEKEMKLKLSDISSRSVKCSKCGHSILFGRRDKTICRWCKNYVYKNKRVEFEEKLKEAMK